jgi:hypothetical protein
VEVVVDVVVVVESTRGEERLGERLFMPVPAPQAVSTEAKVAKVMKRIVFTGPPLYPVLYSMQFAFHLA